MTKAEIKIKVMEALDEIRPFLLNDGGDISLLSVTETVVKIKFLGACTHCSINKMTLKNGIEETVKRHVPQITEVIAVN